ncbi:2-oxoglutarate and Fe(II)-dependent oxygenase superfamily protein isoform 1 [Tripterygium wilfordii]|uniref:2-oxoglutarate and Fe(II)-dependent oxygenase superfamily protein isoform 1 n=1 Tax=Tripterygium wilfordii TaxID=458696 RepID=A0A7J7D6T5_TRIWF|nr:2-oxoglutarate and Fe(II)-dependent oxygenase superfamily protein isoform 1 [Tripterygium wilfordii]
MAGVVVPAEGVPLPKTVQEMSINGEEPPPQFLAKENPFGALDSSPTSDSVPLIDISILSSSDDELEKLRLALSSSGCFQEEKQKCSRAAHDVQGYGHDLIVSDKQVLDWCSRLFLRVFPENQRRDNLWPQIPHDFRDILHEYSMKIKHLMNVLFEAMARSLNLEEKSFSDQFGEQPVMQVRFNFYPPCSRPDMVLGVKPHTDRSGITVLLQDKEVEGLQIIKDGKWITVPVLPDALVVNLGDQMQIMSNGVLKSPVHRVVTNTEKLRMSVAMFNEPDPEKEIGPVEQLMDDNKPRLYRNVKNYAVINYECFQKGIVALETIKIG